MWNPKTERAWTFLPRDVTEPPAQLHSVESSCLLRLKDTSARIPRTTLPSLSQLAQQRCVCALTHTHTHTNASCLGAIRGQPHSEIKNRQKKADGGGLQGPACDSRCWRVSCWGPGTEGTSEFREKCFQREGVSLVSPWSRTDLNAKTAEDNNSSLGAGSEKQTQHQATGSVSPSTKGRAVASGGSECTREGACTETGLNRGPRDRTLFGLCPASICYWAGTRGGL